MPTSFVSKEASSISEQSLSVLIADDSPTDRLLLAKLLENLGYKVKATCDGQQAVEAFQKDLPDIVLLDALMPVMDGFEAARQIKSLSGEALIPIIFLTSLTDPNSLAHCIQSGGDDFVSKPYNPVILKAKMESFERMRQMHLTSQMQRDTIGLHNQHMLNEQQVAKTVFDNVAHQGFLEAPNIQYLLSPCAVFNGDILLATVTPSGNMMVLLGDFTGHGLPAAIGAMPLAEIFYGMAKKGFGMKDILREVNRKLNHVLPVGVFCCACMAEFNFRDPILKVWQGGLPDVYLLRDNKHQLLKIPSNHVALGILKDEQFNDELSVFDTEVGDRLFLWSDGIHEAMNEEGEMFSESRIESIFSNTKQPENIFTNLCNQLNAFVGETEHADDVTLLEVRLAEEAEMQSLVPSSKEATGSGPTDWHWQYEMGPESLKCFNPLPLISHMLMETPGLSLQIGQIHTILSELYANALEHGLLGLDSAMKTSPDGFMAFYQARAERLAALQHGFIRFSLKHTPDFEKLGGSLQIDIEDSGPGFDLSQVAVDKDKSEPNDQALQYCGRGLQLLHSLCESLEYREPGNQVRAVYRWASTT